MVPATVTVAAGAMVDLQARAAAAAVHAVAATAAAADLEADLAVDPLAADLAEGLLVGHLTGATGGTYPLTRGVLLEKTMAYLLTRGGFEAKENQETRWRVSRPKRFQ